MFIFIILAPDFWVLELISSNDLKYFLFTVDVEDWFQVENFKPSIPFDTWNDRELRVERNTHKLLDLFDEMGEDPRGHGFKGVKGSSEPIKLNQLNELNKPNKQSVHATFFMLGWIARKLPGLVKEINSRGHEVASHGINHHLCTHETIDALGKDLADSKKLLEDIIGGPVIGYRAPSFSINDDILNIIEDAGYLYDSSYNSFDKHGRYGKLSTNGFRKSGIAYQVSDAFYELPVSNLTLQPSTFNLQPGSSTLGRRRLFQADTLCRLQKGNPADIGKRGRLQLLPSPVGGGSGSAKS